MAGKGRTTRSSPRVRGEASRRSRPGEGACPSALCPETPPHPRPRQGRLGPLPARGERSSPLAGRDNLVLLGEFGRAHGLNGEVRLKSFTADPAAIAGYGPLTGDDGRRFVLKTVRPAGGTALDMLIVRVEGAATRKAADALNGVRLFIERDRLPAPENEDEFFMADLIGLAVEDTEGQAVGTVVAVPNYGAGDLLEIAPAIGGPSALLPFMEAFVPVVDPLGKRIVIDPPEGLFELDPAPP